MLSQVLVKHKYRLLQGELQVAMAQHNRLVHDHQQYLLERQVQMGSDLIERRARVELGMQTPSKLTTMKLPLQNVVQTRARDGT